MSKAVSRRRAVAGAAVGAVAFGTAARSVSATAEPPSVRGSWRITPELPADVPAFVALSAFGADGIFVTTGSDEPGTGIGQWTATEPDGFEFAYTNFHFDGGGALSSTVTVAATGTFSGSTMQGTAELRRVDAAGAPIGSPMTTPFSGERMSAG